MATTILRRYLLHHQSPPIGQAQRLAASAGVAAAAAHGINEFEFVFIAFIVRDYSRDGLEDDSQRVAY